MILLAAITNAEAAVQIAGDVLGTLVLLAVLLFFLLMSTGSDD